MPSPVEDSSHPPEPRTGAGRKIRGKRLFLGFSLLVLAAILLWYGGRWTRKVRYGITGSVVSTLGHTYYVQPQDNVITPVLLNWGVWERNESQELVEILRAGDTFIDVGADFGWYTVIGAKAVGPIGRVIAFEPVPENLDYLKRNVAVNRCDNVKVEALALSNKGGKLTFHLSQDNLGDHSMVESQDRVGGTIDVQATTLDEYLKDYSGQDRAHQDRHPGGGRLHRGRYGRDHAEAPGDGHPDRIHPQRLASMWLRSRSVSAAVPQAGVRGTVLQQ